MISTAAIAFMASTVALMGEPINAKAGPRTLKANFVREMTAATSNQKMPSAQTPLSSSFRAKVMEKAVEVPAGTRMLQNNQNGNQENGNGNQNARDGADDYFMAFGEWSNGFGFDPTQYSLSYHRCAEVRQYDDELAAQEDSLSVFATKHFAVFRFCPAETCNGFQEEEELSWWNLTYGKWMEEAAEEEEEENEQEGEEEEEEQQWRYQYGEEPDLLGARGDGCQSNYGEYMVELSDYLELMSVYREERFESYCEYCEKCIYNLYNSWMNSQGRERDLKEFSDFTWKDDIEGQDLSAHRELGGCPGINSCWKYKNICGGGIESDYENYFECTEVERNNGMVVYVGPHCAEDGYSVGLGVYGDQYCNEYIGNGVDIQNVLGEKLEDNYLIEYVSGTVESINKLNEFFPEFGFCIPCKESDQPYGIDQDDYSDDYANGNSQVSELCESLYSASARCDKHYRSWTNKAKQSKILSTQMDLQCDFIDSVVLGNYDEMGFVRLTQENITNPTGLTGLIQKTFGLRTAEDPYVPASTVTPLQVFGLCASIMACAILGIWAAALKSGKKMSMKGFRRRAAPQPAVARQDSGIMTGRSGDDASYVASS